MTWTVIHILIVCFAVLGLFELLSLLFDLIFFSGRQPVDDIAVVVRAERARTGLELTVRSLCRRLEDYPTPGGCGRVVLLTPEEGETRQICELLARDIDCVSAVPLGSVTVDDVLGRKSAG